MKICSKCRRELPEEQFHKSKKNKDGYQYICKDCISEYSKRRYASRIDSTHEMAGGGQIERVYSARIIRGVAQAGI